MEFVVMGAAAVWLVAALWFVTRPTPPKKVTGCCPECGCGRCTVNGPCERCAPEGPLRRPLPLPPPRHPTTPPDKLDDPFR